MEEYGAESLNAEKTRQMEQALTVSTRQESFEEPQFDYFLYDEKYTEKNKERKEFIDKRKEEMDASIARITKEIDRDGDLSDQKKYTLSSISESSWLMNRSVPEAKDIDSQMNKASDTFKFARMSKSQKTKRGKKFNEKAALQARMINTMRKCNWQREDAVEDLLKHGRNAQLGFDVSDRINGVGKSLTPSGKQGITEYNRYEDYLKNIGGDVDEVAPVIRDVAFLNEQRFGEGDEDEFNRSYRSIEEIAKPETRERAYARLLIEFSDLDMKRFDYNSNRDFLRDEGDNSFVHRFALLKAFSHAREMLNYLDRNMEEGLKGENSRMLQFINLKRDDLMAKIETLEEVLIDYESRAILLQSPYHVLLSGKEFDKLSEDELTVRMEQTDDEYALKYIKIMLEKKTGDRFAKGKSAEKIFQKKKKKRENERKEDKSRKIKSMNKNQLSSIEEVIETRDDAEKYSRTHSFGPKKKTDSENWKKNGGASYNMVLSSSQAERVVEQSQGFFCVKYLPKNPDFAEIRPSLPDTVRLAGRDFPLRKTYNLMMKAIASMLVDKNGKYSSPDPKITGQLDMKIADIVSEAIIPGPVNRENKIKKTFYQILLPKVLSEFLKTKEEVDQAAKDIRSLIECPMGNDQVRDDFVPDTAFRALSLPVKAYEQRVLAMQGKTEEGEIEKIKNDETLNFYEKELKIKAVKSAFADLREAQTALLRVREMDPDDPEIPVMNDCSSNADCLTKLRLKFMNNGENIPALEVVTSDYREADRDVVSKRFTNMMYNQSTLEKSIYDRFGEKGTRNIRKKWESNQEITTQDKDDLYNELTVYDNHYAANIMTLDGRQYTVEGYASTKTQYVTAPFTLHSAVGIYGENGFKEFYRPEGLVYYTPEDVMKAHFKSQNE